jgi:ADP-ribose pyrophosphatase
MAGLSQGEELPHWEVIGDRLLQACRVWDLRERRYRHPTSGKEGDFYYLDSRDWVVVVARTVEGELILVRQFRWGADALSWELPGGIIDEGEDPVEAGLRELQENPAILNNFCHVVFAEDAVLHESGTDWDEHEEIEVHAMPEAVVMDWARDCKIGHALALNGLLFYQLDQAK